MKEDDRRLKASNRKAFLEREARKKEEARRKKEKAGKKGKGGGKKSSAVEKRKQQGKSQGRGGQGKLEKSDPYGPAYNPEREGRAGFRNYGYERDPEAAYDASVGGEYRRSGYGYGSQRAGHSMGYPDSYHAAAIPEEFRNRLHRLDLRTFAEFVGADYGLIERDDNYVNLRDHQESRRGRKPDADKKAGGKKRTQAKPSGQKKRRKKKEEQEEDFMSWEERDMVVRISNHDRDTWATEVALSYSRSLLPKKRESGYSRWKKERAKEWRRFKTLTSEAFENLQIWQGSFKTIEGRFGSPVLAYFRFLKWLFLLNFLLALIVIGVIILPHVAMQPGNFEESVSNKSYTNVARAINCSLKYSNQNANITVLSQILDFVQGTGWMERTPLFYGYYFNRTVSIENIFSVKYNMSIAYLLTVFAYFIMSLLLMISFTAKGMRNRINASQEQLYLSCNKVFCGWDFSLTDPDAAKFKRIQLSREYMRDLAVKRRKEELKNQSTAKKLCILLVRIVINVIVVAIAAAAAYLIVYMVESSVGWLKLTTVKESAILKLLVEFSPQLTITVLNFVVPLIFQKLVLAENYSPTFEIRITIFRSVTLRLASVIVLLVSVGTRILGCDESEARECNSCENVSLCWETYIGQQFYKLVLLDFITVVLMSFCVQFPRKLIVARLEKSHSKLMKVASYQEFEIPKEVLDIVYSQTICWIGSFLCPMVLCMTVIKFFIFFYIKKLTLLYNCQPSSRLYRASSSQTFFMSILILAFVLCAIPVAFAIGRIHPSNSCGPFRVHSSDDYFMFTAMGDLIDEGPKALKNIIVFITSWTFYVPLIVVVILATYYYVSLAAGKREYIKVLLQQLSVATKDKQFLVQQALARREAAGKVD